MFCEQGDNIIGGGSLQISAIASSSLSVKNPFYYITMRYLLFPMLLLLSCSKPKIEEMHVYSAGVQYDLTSGTGSYYKNVGESEMRRELFNFTVPWGDIEKIRTEYYNSGLDRAEKKVDLESLEKYSNVYGRRSMLIKLSLSNGWNQQIGYSGHVSRAPAKIKGYLTHTYETCKRIRDSLQLKPVTW